MLPPDPLEVMLQMLTGTNRWGTPGQLAHALDPRIRQTPALDLVDQAVMETLNTPDGRLILSMAPQEGKSQRVGIVTPIWQLLRDKNTRVAIGCYGQSLANRNGRAIRNLIITHPELGIRIAPDNGSAHEWQLAGADGGVLSVGRGAGINGRAVDCVRGDMHIECEHGRLTAADAFTRGITRILAYDHADGRAVWRNVEAARRIDGRPTLEIITEAGRVLVCTPDHRVHTGRGYVPAGDLRPGDTLVAVMDAGRVPMWDHLSAAASGPTESDHPQAGSLLHAPLHGDDIRGRESDELLRLRGTHSAKQEGDLLHGVRAGAPGAHASDDRLPAVRGHVPAQVPPDAVLREDVRRSGALASDDWRGQLALQDGHELRQVVPVDATHDLGAGRRGVRGLPAGTDDHLHPQWGNGDTVRAGDSPHQRTAVGQPGREPDHALPRLPHDAPQVTGDTVRMVRESGGEPVAVYDFQVEGTSNFFAEGVLVHNCLIIDDPLKDRTEADSETIRQTCWDWWTDALSTRLGPGAPVILIMTRWHEDDLAGRLLAAEDGHLWRVVNIPAQAESDDDPLGRKPGEWLQSARGNRRWDAIKTRVGSRTWNALYQGRPSPAEGGMVKRDWWQRYQVPLWEQQGDVCHITCDELVISADLSLKGTESSDFVAIGVWARRGTDAYLVDQVRGRMDFISTLREFERLAKRWPQATLKLVEDKANGPALISMLAKRIVGIVPINPTRSKTQRLLAVAPLIESGHVYLPTKELCPWIDDYIEEHAAFPNGAHDDQVDETTMALDRLLLRPFDTSIHTLGDEDWDDYRIGY